MKGRVSTTLLAAAIFCGSALAAGSASTSSEQVSPHEQLASHFVGRWKVEQTFWSNAGSTTETGTEVGEWVLAKRHVLSTLTSQFGGQPFTGITIMSYDSAKQKYLTTWVDSLSTSQFRCDGDYDSKDATYIFRCEMSDPKDSRRIVPVRGVIRIKGDQSHLAEWYVSADGKERLSNRAVYTRVSR